jgi:hypothetical protein
MKKKKKNKKANLVLVRKGIKVLIVNKKNKISA